MNKIGLHLIYGSSIFLNILCVHSVSADVGFEVLRVSKGDGTHQAGKLGESDQFSGFYQRSQSSCQEVLTGTASNGFLNLSGEPQKNPHFVEGGARQTVRWQDFAHPVGFTDGNLVGLHRLIPDQLFDKDPDLDPSAFPYHAVVYLNKMNRFLLLDEHTFEAGSYASTVSPNGKVIAGEIANSVTDNLIPVVWAKVGKNKFRREVILLKQPRHSDVEIGDDLSWTGTIDAVNDASFAFGRYEWEGVDSSGNELEKSFLFGWSRQLGLVQIPTLGFGGVLRDVNNDNWLVGGVYGVPQPTQSMTAIFDRLMKGTVYDRSVETPNSLEWETSSRRRAGLWIIKDLAVPFEEETGPKQNKFIDLESVIIEQFGLDLMEIDSSEAVFINDKYEIVVEVTTESKKSESYGKASKMWFLMWPGSNSNEWVVIPITDLMGKEYQGFRIHRVSDLNEKGDLILNGSTRRGKKVGTFVLKRTIK